MRMRKGAPLLVALAALLGLAQAASASTCGAFRFSIFRNADCDAQCCYSTCQQQNRVSYKLVYDNVLEKRWHTCYKTVCETVNKEVTRTCYREECQTRFRECRVTKCRDVLEEHCRPVQRHCWKEVQCTQYKPCMEQCVKDVECCVCRRVQRCCEKDCVDIVCKPVYEQHCHVHCCQVQKTICEQHCKECCHTVCRRVCETRYKEVCCQISKCVEEHCMRQVCVPCCKDVMETCYKTCVRRVCEPVTTMKCVTKRISECVDEPCAPSNGWFRGWFRQGGGLFGGHGNACGNACGDSCGGNACVGNACAGNACAASNPCQDPCAGKTHHLLERLRSGWGRGHNACDSCNTGDSCSTCNACVPTTRKVWRVRCVTEQVPCTTYVTRCITERVPYTVCRKVRYNEMRQVPVTTRRQVRGAYVDSKGCAHECEGPDRGFRENAIIRKQVPYNVSKMVTMVEKRSVPYTVTRLARGAYADPKGDLFGTDGPGRSFRENAHFKVTNTVTTTRMVQERRVKKVQYTVWENVMERQIKKVPYTVCRMVPTIVTKKVPHTVCEMQKYTVCKKVPYTECVQQPYTVRVKVPYTVTEIVPCTVRKQVQVCVPETVCIRKARMVPCDPGCGPTDACHGGACPPGGCGDACKSGHRLFNGSGFFGNRGGDACCETQRHCFLNSSRQRWFASLHSTGCCEDSCREQGGFMRRLFGHGWRDSCNDGCHNYCNEGLLQRLFRNRFCCEPTCCNSGGCAGGACAPGPVVPLPEGPLPRVLPKN